MTLHEAIQYVLRESDRPMAAANIAAIINERNYYERADHEPLSANQIFSRIKNYPSLFQSINGLILLVEDKAWRNFLTGYKFIGDVLKGIYDASEVQFITAALLYAKRLIDINQNNISVKSHIYSINDLLEIGCIILKHKQMLKQSENTSKEVFDECSRLIDKLEPYKREELWNVITTINTQKLSDLEFGTMYNYLLTGISADQIKHSLHATPYSLRQLMVGLLDPKSGRVLYDPVAGTGNLLIEVLLQKERMLKGVGSEINKRAAQLGNLNLIAHGFSEAVIVAEDCFERVKDDFQYDYIIGDLPANGVTNSWEHQLLYRQFGLSVPQSGKSFGSLVLYSFFKLNFSGKAVLTVSDGFLIKKGREMEVRKLLLQQDVIESIISLPYGTLRPYTDAKASIIILNKDKPVSMQQRIQLITAQAVEQNAKSLVLDVEEVLTAYFSKSDFSKNSQIIAISDLRSDSNLSVDAFAPQFILGNMLLKDGKARRLGDMVIMKTGITPERQDIHVDASVPLIKVENLAKDILDIQIDTSKTDRVDSSERYQRNIINQECILVARIGEHLKATIFRPTLKEPKILPHANVTTLIVDQTDLVNIEYLYYQLHSVFILEQIERRKLGTVMPYISISGLKEILIPFMSLTAQNEFVQSQKANLIAEERQRIEERITALGYREETKQAEADVIKTLTHQLRPTFTGLNNLSNRIERIVQREKLGQLLEYEKLKVEIDPELEGQITTPDNFSLSQLMQKLSSDTRHLSNILTNVDKVMNFKLAKEDLQPIDLSQFLQNYRRQKSIEQGHNYQIEVKGEPFFVLLHEPSFKELLDQLLINADRHAFPSATTKRSNRVQFNVRTSKQRNVVILEYSNNGLPYELTKKDFVTAFEKGQKSDGSGIGGNYINRIVEAHDGMLSIAEGYKKGFSLTIELPSPTT